MFDKERPALPQSRTPDLASSRCNACCSHTTKRWGRVCVTAALVACTTVLTIAVSGGFRVQEDRQHVGFGRHSKSVVGDYFKHRPNEGSDRNKLSPEGDFDASRLMRAANLGDEKNGFSQEEGIKGDVQAEDKMDEAEGKPDTLPLPQCYSRPSADPSKGAWARCKNGVNESAVDMVHWKYSYMRTRREAGCSEKWGKRHSSEGTMPYFEWQAEDCWLEKVDAAKFCHVMEGRKGILFVGDSLSHQMSTTLASILRAEIFHTGRDTQHLNKWLACDGALKVTFKRNDFLDTRTNEFPGDKGTDCDISKVGNAHCTVFADDETLKGYDTLVVNSGAHQNPEKKYGPVMEVASKVIAASMRRLHGKEDTILVVRNTAPGHWECDERMFQGPVELDVALRLNSAGKWDWSGYRGQNGNLKQAFMNNSEDGWRWLDVYTPTVLRADSHPGGGDCLHYCMPGPVDHWVRLFYNMLIAATAKSNGGE